jgi:hypothetical protein
VHRDVMRCDAMRCDAMLVGLRGAAVSTTPLVVIAVEDEPEHTRRMEGPVR